MLCVYCGSGYIMWWYFKYYILCFMYYIYCYYLIMDYGMLGSFMVYMVYIGSVCGNKDKGIGTLFMMLGSRMLGCY